MRSSAYTMTTDNAEAQLPLPIYKIKNISINLDNLDLYLNTGSIKNYTNSNGNYLKEIDVTKYVVTSKEWNALPASSGENKPYYNGIYKDNTFYWEEGAQTLAFVGTVYKLGNWFANGFDGVDEAPTYKRLLESAIYSIGDKYKKSNGESLQDALKDGFFIGIPDVREWQYRIEYVPISSKTKIRARKNAPTKQEYIQPFNQRAEINAASAFGKNMYLTAQKTGCREITIVKNYTRLKDIPPLGALVRHNGKRYRLVANHYVQTNIVYIQVTHTLSENWSERSKHVAVDQKYRNWSIPQDTLWRNLYWEDYLRVGTSPKKSDNVTGGISLANIMRGLYVEINEDKTVDTFAWVTSEGLGTANGMEVTGATVPCSTYGIANSLIFSASFKDNLSAGLRAAKWGEENTTTKAIEYLCEEALYCKADGTLDKASVVLGEGVSNYNSVVYPSVCGDTNTVENEVFNKEFYIYKDAGEALKFTYQIHLIGEDDCFFGNKFAEHNPLIKKWNVNRKFKVWALTHYVREGSDILETVTGDKAFDHVIDNLVSGADKAKFSIYQETSYDASEYGEVYTVKLLYTFFDELNKGGYRSWAITDENNNLYVACNDVSVRRLYFQLHHKR
jgi:hypothetical protein